MSPDPASDDPKKRLFGHFALIGKALSCDHRLALLELLAQGSRDVDTLARLAQLSAANASQHLKHLGRAGLVTARRDGKHVIYRLTDNAVIELLAALRRIAESNLAEVGMVVANHFRDGDGLEPVSREELLRRMRAGAVTVVDVRAPEEYAAGHLPGAVNVTLATLEQRLDALPRGAEIVAYCRGPYCAPTFEAVAAFRRAGFKARRLEDGFPEWRAAGLPVQAEPAGA